jgi:hypothetical protein
VVLRVPGHRHRLRQREQWTHEQLRASQARALRQLREHADAIRRRPDAFDDAAPADRLTRELHTRRALPPPVQVQRVRAIPRTTLGKAPSITRGT